MLLTLLLSIDFLCGFLDILIQKKNSITLALHKGAYLIYVVLSSVAACIFFFLCGGGHIRINLPTLWFSVIFAGLALISMIFGLVLYQFAKVASVGIIRHTAILLLTALSGVLIFHETITAMKIIRILLLLLSSFFLFLANRREESEPMPRRKMIRFFGVLLLMVLNGTAVSVVMKAFSDAENVTDSNSFFFLTNCIILFFALIVFLIAICRKKSPDNAEPNPIRLSEILFLGCGNLFSNVLSLLEVLILKRCDLSFFSSFALASNIVVSAIVSVIFRERLGKYTCIAVVIATIAIVITI